MSERTLNLELVVENVTTKQDLHAIADEILQKDNPRQPTSTHEQMTIITSTVLKTVRRALGTEVTCEVALDDEYNFEVTVMGISSKFDSHRDLIMHYLIKNIEEQGFPVLQHVEVVV